MIINQDHPAYRRMLTGKQFYNGAFYYSKEICKNIIPNVDTDRHWVTIRVPGVCVDHSVVFIHNNVTPHYYDYLADYKDLILVCGVPDTCKMVKHLGMAIYLPLSVDVDYVAQFKAEKTKDTAFVGRRAKTKYGSLPYGIDYLCGIKRQELLPMMAQYKNVYGVGRVAIEAKILGCKVLPYDERFPNPKRWRVLDNKDAAKILQQKINKIDG